jgi:hypothetical protein
MNFWVEIMTMLPATLFVFYLFSVIEWRPTTIMGRKIRFWTIVIFVAVVWMLELIILDLVFGIDML